MSWYACLDVFPCACLSVAKYGRINHDFVIRPFFNTVAHETRIQSLLCAVEASGALYLYTIQFKGHTVPITLHMAPASCWVYNRKIQIKFPSNIFKNSENFKILSYGTNHLVARSYAQENGRWPLLFLIWVHMRVDGAWGSFYSTNQGTFGLDGLPGGKFGKFDCAPLGTTKPLKSPNKLSQALRMLDAGHYTKYLIV